MTERPLPPEDHRQSASRALDEANATLRASDKGQIVLWVALAFVAYTLLGRFIGGYATFIALALAGVAVARAWIVRSQPEKSALPPFFWRVTLVLFLAGGLYVLDVAAVTYIALRAFNRLGPGHHGKRERLPNSVQSLLNPLFSRLSMFRQRHPRLPRLGQRGVIVLLVVLLAAATAGLLFAHHAQVQSNTAGARQAVTEAIPAIQAFGEVCGGYNSSARVRCADGSRRIFSVAALRQMDPKVELNDAIGTAHGYCVDSSRGGSEVAYLQRSAANVTQFVAGKSCAQLVGDTFAGQNQRAVKAAAAAQVRSHRERAKQSVREAIPAIQAYGSDCHGYSSTACSDGIFGLQALQQLDPKVTLTDVMSTTSGGYCVDRVIGSQTVSYIKPGQGLVVGESCSQLSN